MEDEKYSSGSDDSDDEYCPDEKVTEQLSEEESGSNDEEQLDSENDEKTKNSKTRGRKRSKKQTTTKKKQRKDDSEAYESSEEESVQVKRKVLTEEEEKQKADALWASFMGETKSSEENKATVKAKQLKIDSSSCSTNSNENSQPAAEEPKKITVTETYDFAGEKVEVTKEVDSNTLNNSSVKSTNSTLPVVGRQRPSGGGLGSLLGQIGKQKKISTLEKSKLDWDGFKRREGIEEEIQTHNKGKDGYLEKQDFLQRTDFKQFDIEKNLRQTKRSNR